MPDYTIVQLIKDVKRHGSVPSNQNLYEDEDFAASFSDCLSMRVIPSILRTREEYFVTSTDYAFSSLTTLSGDRLSLKLPSRAIANRIRLMQLIDASGNILADIPRLHVEENNEFAFSDEFPFGYIFQGNNIIVNSDLNASGNQIRLHYFRRPSRLAEILRAGKITAINTMTGSITLDNVPSDWVAGTLIDIQSGLAPFDAKVDSASIIAVGSPSITVSTTVASAVAVGDYVCYEHESVIPQIPIELHPILVQFALATILKSLGDREGASMVMADLPKLEDELYEMLESRDDGSEQKLVAPNGLWTQGIVKLRGW